MPKHVADAVQLQRLKAFEIQKRREVVDVGGVALAARAQIEDMAVSMQQLAA